MGFNMPLWLQVGLIVLKFLQGAQALVIQQKPTIDTELYVAPATYTLKDGRALPSTIIISRPLGVHSDSSEDSGEDDLPQGSFTIIPARDKKPNLGSLDLKPNIQFYKIECTSGRSCTSIIPAKKTTPPDPPVIPFTETELKQYLAQFGLYDGFPYNNDYENSGNPSRPNGDESDRAFGSAYHDNNNFWPGSSYRPGNQPSKGQILKFQHFDTNINNRPIVDFPTQKPMPDFLTRRPMTDFPLRPGPDWTKVTQSFPTRTPSTKWEKVPAVRPVQNDRFSHHTTIPYDNFPRPLGHGAYDDAILPPYGPPRPSSPPRPTARPTSYEGIWNRYGVSTVSQLDRDTGEWVKVSSSSTKIDQGIFDYPDTLSPGTLSPVTHHTKASLTVLGISDREPHSSFSNSNAFKPHTVKIPSANPGKPPETIETDGGYVQNIASVHLPISYPLRPASPNPLSGNPSGFAQVSVPLSILASQSILDTVSNDSSSTTSTITTTTTSTTTTTTTTTTPPIVTPRTTTTTTQPPPQAQASEGGGTFLDNPYAVMAAVGAGLIPATFAALLPVFVGRKRRRRRRSAANPYFYPEFNVPGISETLLAEMGLRVKRALIKNGIKFER